ncbi:salivary glue protein Sgs-3 [Halyomorpha halys]|uniref:salivary glue protein Sgs-3 n=1 Tax=Halyomorpha halys TaxID=286706 RepID=UPI0034D36492
MGLLKIWRPRSPVDFQFVEEHEVPLGAVRPGGCVGGHPSGGHSFADGAECLILWTSQLVRRVKEFVFYFPPTYYHGPPVYTGGTFFGGGSGVPSGWRPVSLRPGGNKPTTPKPGGRKPPAPRPGGTKPSNLNPGSDKSKGTRPTSRRPAGTKPTTPRTTTRISTTASTTTRISTTASTTTATFPTQETVQDETTVRPFYNMLCGVCPPMKQCLCPGVHF